MSLPALTPSRPATDRSAPRRHGPSHPYASYPTTAGGTSAGTALSARGPDLVSRERAAVHAHVKARGRAGVERGGHRGNDGTYLFEPPVAATLVVDGGAGGGGATADAAPSSSVFDPPAHVALDPPKPHALRDALVAEARTLAKDMNLPVAALPAHFRLVNEAIGGPSPPRTAAAGGRSAFGTPPPPGSAPEQALPAQPSRMPHSSAARPATQPGRPRFADGDRPALSFPSALPTSRADVIASIDALEAALAALPADATLPQRLGVLDEGLVEVIRQTLVGCVERGVLLEFLRVSVFACVNELLSASVAAKEETEEADARAAAAEAKTAELEAQLEAALAERDAERRKTKRREILDITSAAKRSKEYVDYATKHFDRAIVTIAQEQEDAEVKQRYFSLMLKANVDKKETSDRYIDALNEVKRLQVKTDRLKEQLQAANDQVATQETYIERLRNVAERGGALTQSLLAGPAEAAGGEGQHVADWVDVAVGTSDHAPPPTADIAVDTEDLRSPDGLRGRTSVFQSLAGSQFFAARRATQASFNLPPASRRKSTFVPIGARSRMSVFGSHAAAAAAANSASAYGRRRRSSSGGGLTKLTSPTLGPQLDSEDDEDEEGRSTTSAPRRTRVNFAVADAVAKESDSDEGPRAAGTQTLPMEGPVTLDEETDAAELRLYTNAACCSDAATDAPESGALARPSCHVDIETQTETDSFDFVIPDMHLPAHGHGRRGRHGSEMHVPDSQFDLISRRLPLDKAKARPRKWVVSTVLHVSLFVLEQETPITPELDISGTALSYFRSKYGLEKLSDQYVADFIKSAKKELPGSRRIGCFVRFVGLHRFLGLPESGSTGIAGDSMSSLMVGGRDMGELSVSALKNRSTRHDASPAGVLTGGGGKNVAVPWRFFAHYMYLLSVMRKLMPRKTQKELEESDAMELPSLGCLQLLRHAYKKRLSERSIRRLTATLNEFDRTSIQPMAPIPPLSASPNESDALTAAWPVDLLLELIAFSTDTLFTELFDDSGAELSALGVTGVDDPQAWNPNH